MNWILWVMTFLLMGVIAWFAISWLAFLALAVFVARIREHLGD